MRKLTGALLRVTTCLVALSVLGLSLHAQSQPEPASLSPDLLQYLSEQSDRTIRVIASGDPLEIETARQRLGVQLRRQLARGAALEVSREQLERLRRGGEIQHLSADAPVLATMEVTNPTVAADQVWAGWSGGILGSYPGVTGQGVRIAVIDSGIAGNHAALKNKILASVDLTSGATGTQDEFGHGTHVAGIIAGRVTSGSTAAGYTVGVAPGARLINVRVLGPDGSGLTSDVIAGIDWVIANRSRYDIRVINLSLGHPVMEPSATDPLCQAVARAVSAGVVVVASAGNAGRASNGAPVLGGISSPGNSPFAITVGALNAHGTTARSDDTVASYSSRGPTKFEFAVKPDVVAPGTAIVAPEAPNSWIGNNYPVFHVAGSGNNGYMKLSGTSMSAAVVSGGVALLLEANPNLTPWQVKLALQTTSTFMPDAGLVGAGAGSINLRGARQVANEGLLDSVATDIAGQVVTGSGVAFWDAGALILRVYGPVRYRLLSLLQGPMVWLNPGLLAWGDLNLLGLENPRAQDASDYIVWGDVADWAGSDYIVWGDTIVTPEGEYIVWGDNSSDYIVWGDTTSEEAPPDYIVWGDSTPSPPGP